MSTPWTPGPWAIVKAKEPTDGGIDHAIVAPLAGKSTVIAEAFQVVGEGLRAPSLANASLMSAAPELYEMLSTILEICEVGDDDRIREFAENIGYHETYIVEGHIKAAKAALAKARGEA